MYVGIFHLLDDILEIQIMSIKRHKSKQIIAKLQQIEVFTSQGNSLAAACKEAAISEQNYYR